MVSKEKPTSPGIGCLAAAAGWWWAGSKLLKTVFLVGIGFTFLSVVGLFVVPNALAGLHIWDAGESEIAGDGSELDLLTPGNAEELAEEYYSIYTSVIDDMLSYQQNPDLERVEAQRQASVKQAQELIPRFKALARKLSKDLDELSAQASATPQPAP